MAHTFRTPLKLMTEPQREWFASAMISIILADGAVSQAEVETLMQTIGFVANPQAAERLKKFVHFQSVPQLAPFHGWEKELRNRAIMMLDLMDVAIADRDFSANERAQFLQIGKLLGFTPAKVEELIKHGDEIIEKESKEV